MKTVESLNWALLPHPTHTVLVWPQSEFYMFDPKKEGLRGKRFESKEDVKAAVRVWLRRQIEESFAEG